MLYGSIAFNANNQSYTIYHNVSSGWSVSTNIPVQKDGRKGGFKTYTIAYVVYEKASARPPPSRCVGGVRVAEVERGVGTCWAPPGGPGPLPVSTLLWCL
jgi:hypothetical protein